MARWWSLHEDLHAATQVRAESAWKLHVPRRSLPSWLGWNLHTNGGGDIVGAGLAVALLSPLARVLPGGPARVLPWRAGVPGKDLARGLVGLFGKDLDGECCPPILI